MLNNFLQKNITLKIIWVFFVSAFFCVNMFIVFYGTYFYFNIYNKDFSDFLTSPVKSERFSLVNTDDLRNIISNFEIKSGGFKQLLVEKGEKVVDLSL